jgi:multicomponent Na+:H+ antiporter subunit E
MVSRGVFFLLIWYVLSNGVAASWWIGLPAVVIAVIASVRLQTPVPFSWLALFRFIPFFAFMSLRGGVDVARRVFRRELSIEPDLVDYQLRLPPGLPQVMMTNTVGLLPGTLGAELGTRVLRVHVLDRGTDFMQELAAVELGIARMFRISLPPAGGNA